MPQISLILCVKNGLPFLRDAVASVAAQTYRNFELIVQDGLSTDGSLEWLGRVEGIPAIDIETAADTGIGQAYNRAVRRCRGDIIGSIDADNVLEPDALAAVAAFFEARPDLAVAYGAAKLITPDGKTIGGFSAAPFDLLSLLRCELVPPFATSFFARRKCAAELRFDETMKTCADYDLWLRLSHLPIGRIETCLGSTRISQKSMTCHPEKYEQFCRDKIAALERFLAGRPTDPVIGALRRHLLAGVYTWAAESVRRLEGESELFRAYRTRAADLDPYSARLPFLLTHTRLQHVEKELEKTRAELHATQEQILLMETSKFWKLRSYVTRIVPERFRALSWRRSAA
jgi:glycosyltransferase involved in cell wall biosynthesis